MIQLGKFVGGGGVADTNYLYPARWGWINNISLQIILFAVLINNNPWLSPLTLVYSKQLNITIFFS